MLQVRRSGGIAAAVRRSSDLGTVGIVGASQMDARFAAAVALGGLRIVLDIPAMQGRQ